MPADASGVKANLHRSDEHSWALITRAPNSRLKPYVIDYWGYRERARTPMRRLQPPFAGHPDDRDLRPLDRHHQRRPAD